MRDGGVSRVSVGTSACVRNGLWWNGMARNEVKWSGMGWSGVECSGDEHEYGMKRV